jgi:hypothetical protein
MIHLKNKIQVIELKNVQTDEVVQTFVVLPGKNRELKRAFTTDGSILIQSIDALDLEELIITALHRITNERGAGVGVLVKRTIGD